MFAVTVTFDLHPGRMEAFLPHMLANARASRAEPACRRFDVLQDATKPDRVFLYELYDDAAGFDTHLTTVHFKQFAAVVEPMIRAKQTDTWDGVTEA